MRPLTPALIRQWHRGTTVARTTTSAYAYEVIKDLPAVTFVLARQSESRFKLVGTQPTFPESHEDFIRKEYV